MFRREGVRTKHFRAGDLEPVLRLAGFKLLSLDRVEYDWCTEFHPPTGREAGREARLRVAFTKRGWDG